MGIRLYYVNDKDKAALFIGEYNSEPDLSNHPHVRTWMEAYGPAKAHFMPPGARAVYPWADGRGGVDGRWKLWMMFPSNYHTMRPSGEWKAWPTDELSMLAGIPRGRR